MNENIILSSKPIEISEFPNHKEAVFLISVLDEYNLNNVLIEKSEGEKYYKTIIGYPILAYLKYDKDKNPSDFGGHELRKKYNPKTKEIEYYFATFPIGSVIDTWIEKREVEGYEGEKECILIKTKLWKSRFPNYFEVFDKLWDSGKLSSSWEISVAKSEKTDRGKKLIEFEFIGNCCLGSTVKGAVNGAGVLEVAEQDENINYELSKAIEHDILLLSSSTDDYNNINNEERGDNMPNPNKEKEVSSLTDSDIYKKVRQAINSIDNSKWYYVSMIYPYEFRAIAYNWDREKDEDFIEFSYTVNSDDTISINSQKDVKMVFQPKETVESQLAEKDTKISELETELTNVKKEFSEAGQAINTLTSEKENLETQISELQPFKEKFEEMQKAENERLLSEKKQELSSFTLEDNLIAEEEITNDEKLATIFSELTLDNFEQSKEKIEFIKGKKALEKFKAQKQTEKSEVETSTENTETSTLAKTNISGNDEDNLLFSAVDIVKMSLNKK